MTQIFAKAAGEHWEERRKLRSWALLLDDFDPVPVGVLETKAALAGQGPCRGDQAAVAHRNAHRRGALTDRVERVAVAGHQCEMKHRIVVHLQLVMLHQAKV